MGEEDDKVTTSLSPTLTCPEHGRVKPVIAWCRSDGRLHKGARCPFCGLWLRWLPPENPPLDFMQGGPWVSPFEATIAWYRPIMEITTGDAAGERRRVVGTSEVGDLILEEGGWHEQPSRRREGVASVLLRARP